MLLFIEKKLENMGRILDNRVFQSSILETFFCWFFDLTSRITNFLLFHQFGYPLFLFSIGLFIQHYFSFFNILFRNIKLFGLSQIVDILLSLPIGFICGLLFFLFFYQAVFINTLLAYSHKVKKFMTNKYHENIMKD